MHFSSPASPVELQTCLCVYTEMHVYMHTHGQITENVKPPKLSPV